jgi:hypothetical protein
MQARRGVTQELSVRRNERTECHNPELCTATADWQAIASLNRSVFLQNEFEPAGIRAFPTLARGRYAIAGHSGAGSGLKHTSTQRTPLF